MNKEIDSLKNEISKLISIIDKQDNSLIKKQRRLDVLTSNVVDATYHANTVKKLNDQIEALGLDIYYMNQSIYNANSKLEQANKEKEYWKREAQKATERYEDSLKSKATIDCEGTMKVLWIKGNNQSDSEFELLRDQMILDDLKQEFIKHRKSQD